MVALGVQAHPLISEPILSAFLFQEQFQIQLPQGLALFSDFLSFCFIHLLHFSFSSIIHKQCIFV